MTEIIIPLATLRKILRREGMSRISKDAIIHLSEHIRQDTIEVGKKAFMLARHAKRVTINEDDIRLAISSRTKEVP